MSDLADEVVRRLKREGGFVVRLSDQQLDEIAYRVLELLDERLAPREIPRDPSPARNSSRRRRLL